MRIFLTGGTGFIGSYFLRSALEAGYSITALRRTSGAKIPLLREPCWLERIMPEVTSADLGGHDALVHLTAVGVSPQKADWATLFRVNVTESLDLWQRAADAGIHRFLICGSCFEYGTAGERYDSIPPDAPLEPSSAYGASKAAATMAAVALARERRLSLTVARPFHTFGEGQHRDNFWPSLRSAALAGADFPMTAGAQVRDFMPVEDVAAAFLRLLETSPTPGEPVIRNIGTGHPTTLRAFAESWWSRWNASGKLLPGALPYSAREVMRYVPLVGSTTGGSPMPL
jgi:nucleoside-diphosphate-sugar epimerase